MSPRPADLEPEHQYQVARAVCDSMTPDERRMFCIYMSGYQPQLLVTWVEKWRHEGHLPDGWDQALWD